MEFSEETEKLEVNIDYSEIILPLTPLFITFGPPTYKKGSDISNQ